MEEEEELTDQFLIDLERRMMRDREKLDALRRHDREKLDALCRRVCRDREKLDVLYRRACRDKFRGILVIKLDLACKVKALKFLRGKPTLLPGEVQYYSDGCIVIYPEDACLRHEAKFGDILVIKLDFASKVKELRVQLGELIWHMPEEAQYFFGGCIIIPEEY